MTHLSLFSGIGGFDVGFQRAGIATVALCEIDPCARDILRMHWPRVPVHLDVHDVHGCDYRHVDIISGGDPCQANSVAGAQAGSRRLPVAGEFVRITGEAEPVWIVRENPTITRAGAPWPAERFAVCLEELGYSACILEMQCAPLTGVLRNRSFVVGSDPGRIGCLEQLLPVGERTERTRAAHAGPREVLAGLTCHGRRYDTRDNYLVDTDGRVRVPSITERLGAQGFPADWFGRLDEYGGRISHRCADRLTGNAVPVQVAAQIGEWICAVEVELDE